MTSKFVITDDGNGNDLTETECFEVMLKNETPIKWTPSTHFETIEQVCNYLMKTVAEPTTEIAIHRRNKKYT